MREQHGDKGTKLYNTWCNMKARCNNKSNPIYGGKGIKVSEEWRLYTVFKMWAMAKGYADNLTIDRIDSNGNYEPSNCRWVDSKVQNNNRSNNVVVDETTVTLRCEELGIDSRLILARMREQGMEFSQAIKLGQNFRHYKILYEDNEYNLKELCMKLGLNYDTVYKRIKKYGWTLQKSLDCKACQWILDNKEQK